MYKLFTINNVEKRFQIIDLKNDSVFNYVNKIKASNGETLGYSVTHNLAYYSPRYKKWVLIEVGDKSDGATFVPDIDSFGWLVHDDLCNFGVFHDGTKCTNWQASMILSDVLAKDNHGFRSYTWLWGTWLFGGGKARKNGMW